MRRHVGDLSKPQHSAMSKHVAPAVQELFSLSEKHALNVLLSGVTYEANFRAHPAFCVLGLHVHEIQDHGNVVAHVQIIIHSCLVPTNRGKQVAALSVFQIEAEIVRR